jgi:hypothetical protein
MLHPQNAAAQATVGAPATAASRAAKCSSPSPVAQPRGRCIPTAPRLLPPSAPRVPVSPPPSIPAPPLPRRLRARRAEHGVAPLEALQTRLGALQTRLGETAAGRGSAKRLRAEARRDADPGADDLPLHSPDPDRASPARSLGAARLSGVQRGALICELTVVAGRDREQRAPRPSRAPRGGGRAGAAAMEEHDPPTADAAPATATMSSDSAGGDADPVPSLIFPCSGGGHHVELGGGA